MWINKDLAILLLKKKSRYKVIYGGRGSSKSMGAGTAVINHAVNNPNSKILCVRGTQSKISDSSLQILKDVIFMMGLEHYFEITEHTLRCKNGSDFLFYGAKAYQQFKSLQGINLCWIDEAVELSTMAWEYLIPTIREEDSEIWITFNPEREDDWCYKEFITQYRDDAIVLKLNYYDNPLFPYVLRKEMEWDKSHNLNKYLHVWEGELIKAVEGALWNRDLIKYIDKEEYIEMVNLKFAFDKIVVAIDPSITSNVNSDACGLIVAGKYKDKYIILEDSTAVLSPDMWASEAIRLYNVWKADHIVYETNQGGDMVRTIINQKDRSIRCIGVHASRGKILRAEPIVQLYEQGLVKHLKHFPGLEYEMVTYSGDSKDKSPNSLDAMVWALTDLSGLRINPRNTRPANMGLMKLRAV